MDVRATAGGGWEAVADDGTVDGHAEVWVRPDGRAFLHLADRSTAAARVALLRHVPGQVEGELHHWVPSDAPGEREALTAQGFEERRREDHVEIDPRRADAWLREHPGPDVELVGVDEVPLDRLRMLDEELRSDVPGCDGWRWDPAVFRAETFSAGHDDRLYRVAVEDGELLGLVRVWVDRDAPRIGLVAVRRQHRQRGIARTLLASVFAELAAREEPVVVTEADPTNTPVRRLFDGLGATVVRTYLDLARPA